MWSPNGKVWSPEKEKNASPKFCIYYVVSLSLLAK